jgi:murein DD-endopeptidase MepM/ murein hydrolase activator NlpD
MQVKLFFKIAVFRCHPAYIGPLLMVFFLTSAISCAPIKKQSWEMDFYRTQAPKPKQSELKWPKWQSTRPAKPAKTQKRPPKKLVKPVTITPVKPKDNRRSLDELFQEEDDDNYLVLQWPVDVVHVTSFYGYRQDPVRRKQVRFHSGIDLGGGRGTLIRAAADGVVRESRMKGSYGNTVIIDHAGGYSSLYAHLATFWVEAGQRLHSGQSIGLMGSTGRSTGPHLHFSVRKDDRSVNPLELIEIPVVVE